MKPQSKREMIIFYIKLWLFNIVWYSVFYFGLVKNAKNQLGFGYVCLIMWLVNTIYCIALIIKEIKYKSKDSL